MTKKRLAALELAVEKARVGGDLLPVEVWSQDQADPELFTLEGTGERLTREEVEARKAQVLLVSIGRVSG